MRVINEKRLKELENIYMGKQENSQVGPIIRERMGLRSRSESDEGDMERAEDQDAIPMDKKKKSVKIVEDGGDQKKHMDRRVQSAKRAPNSRSGSRKRKEESPVVYHSPRQQLYDAKFEKYLANKDQKIKQEKKLEKLVKENFEIYMRGPESPSKKASRFHSKEHGNKYDPESLIPANYEEELLKKKQEEGNTVTQTNSKDPFKKLGVCNEDKMTYFLLKWIFNAIKRDSSVEDSKLNGNPFITKLDLVK